MHLRVEVHGRSLSVLLQVNQLVKGQSGQPIRLWIVAAEFHI